MKKTRVIVGAHGVARDGVQGTALNRVNRRKVLGPGANIAVLVKVALG
jgi:hypothetical protein